jgi:hypothetical protein
MAGRAPGKADHSAWRKKDGIGRQKVQGEKLLNMDDAVLCKLIELAESYTLKDVTMKHHTQKDQPGETETGWERFTASS